MSCSVFKINLDLQRRYLAGTIAKHTEMNDWLKEHGEKNFIYEVWKVTGIHSRWMWKTKRDKWGRLATPSNNT